MLIAVGCEGWCGGPAWDEEALGILTGSQSREVQVQGLLCAQSSVVTGRTSTRVPLNLGKCLIFRTLELNLKSTFFPG